MPKWLFGHAVFWMPGVPRPKNTHCQANNCFWAMPLKAARPQNHDFRQTCMVFWPWYPRPPQKPLGRKNTSGSHPIKPFGAAARRPRSFLPRAQDSGSMQGLGPSCRLSAQHHFPSCTYILKAKMKFENKLHPGSGPKSTQNHRSPYENDSPDPPRTPRGEGGQEQI
jgi:hypothetical protein